MKRPLFKQRVKGDFVVIDSQFPQKDPFAFRNAEINEYIRKVENMDAYAMSKTYPPAGAPFAHPYGMTEADYVANKEGYLAHYPQNKKRIRYLSKDKKYTFRLAYSFFLAETYTLLPFYEENNVPFVFVLYPGGLFGLDSDASDGMLRGIFASKNFRGVIVTQQITRDYLLEKGFCPADKVHYIYGGMVQFKQEEVLQKQRYKNGKDTFDVCFVAAKYSECGIDKGYDLFIETAKKLAKQSDDIMFHVVGGFDENDIDVGLLEGRIRFYGYKKPEFLREFYSRMDIFLSPNRPHQLFEGNFDGFPLGIDAGYCGVALFVADELRMNHHYDPDTNIVILQLDSNWISKKIMSFYRNPDRLYELASKGQQRTQQLFDQDYQIDERLKVFGMYVKLKGADI